MLLEILLIDKEFCALLALVELGALFSRQLEQVLIGRQCFLLQPQLFLKHQIFGLLLFAGIADPCRFFIALLVV